MVNQIEKALMDFGLNEVEIKVYLQSLQTGTAPASTLAKRLDMIRSTVQYNCQQLTKKGLLTLVDQNGVYLYSPEDPEKLVQLMEREKNQIRLKQLQIAKVMPELKTLLNPHVKLPKVRFFQGRDGLIEMFDDVLKEGKTLYGAAHYGDHLDPVVVQYLEEVYIINRQKNPFKSYILFNKSDTARYFVKIDKQLNRQSLFIDPENNLFPTAIHIYANKVAYYSYHKDDLTGVLIQSSSVYESQLSLFKLAWNQARNLEVNQGNKVDQI